MSDRLLKIKEVAEILSIAPQTIRNNITAKKNLFPIKPVRIGGAIRFSLKAVEDFIEKSQAKE
jgi:predicted DNA-binding transcriptional regulator AlpA